MRRRVWPLLVVVLAGCAPAPEAVPAVVPTFETPPATAVAPPTLVSPELPVECGALVPGAQLDAVLGAPVSASTEVVVGEAIPDIGRTARTTCRYGVGVAAGFLLEVSLTSYTTPDQAQDRVRVTVDSAGREGVAGAPVATGGTDGVFLPFPSGGLVVASAGVYSVAVTAQPALLPPETVAQRLGAVAGIVLAAAGV